MRDYHYPPEVFDLMVEAIYRINKSKEGLLIFFSGAGVPEDVLLEFRQQLTSDSTNFRKPIVTRRILDKLNKGQDKYIGQRRELIKRVVEFESFDHLFPDDQAQAKLKVFELAKIVNVKDSFTRMDLQREQEAKVHKENYAKKLHEENLRREEHNAVLKRFSELFTATDPHRRGVLLEKVLNDFFSTAGIAVSEAFVRTGQNQTGVIEQIDGVIRHDSRLVFVEMKWLAQKVDGHDVLSHLGKLHLRGSNGRGMFISYSGYTAAAIQHANDALSASTELILVNLKELYDACRQEEDLDILIRKKFDNLQMYKNSYS